jgi:hypothetical protein
MFMNKLPLARSADIVVQSIGKEILIYDLITHKAYNLNETSSIVYQACDGKTSFDELRRKHSFTDDLIFLALDQLKEDNLVETDSSFVSPFTGMSRREAIRRVGLASMIALPVISSLVAPTAAMAQSACTADLQYLSAGTQAGCIACQSALNSRCCSGRAGLYNCGVNVFCEGVCLS